MTDQRFASTAALVAADQAYIRAHFVPGESVPGYAGPAYVLDDGTAMFAPGHFALLDPGGDVEAEFLSRYDGVEDRDDEFAAWLTGIYGVCLRSATPENIALKGRLVQRIEAALAAPAVDDPRWRAGLHADVDALDAIERPFAPLDALRLGGPPSRQRLVDWPRARWEWLRSPVAVRTAA
jgi:hypothetical protein